MLWLGCNLRRQGSGFTAILSAFELGTVTPSSTVGLPLSGKKSGK